MHKYQDTYFDNIAQIDMILEKKQPTRQQVEFVLNMIQSKHYRKYFFKNVTAQHWFNILKKGDYLNLLKILIFKKRKKRDYILSPNGMSSRT